MIVADTDVLIDYLTGTGEADTVGKLLGQRALGTTVITRFELLSGAKSRKQIARLQQLLQVLPSLVLDEAAADSAREVRQALEKNGNPIGMADSLIAGIVMSNGASLLTRNRRHFERIPGIRLA